MTDAVGDDDDGGYDIGFERLEPGRYAVFAQVVIDGTVEQRRRECSNPAYGFAQLEEEICDLLSAREMARPRSTRLLPFTKAELDAMDADDEVIIKADKKAARMGKKKV
jgi:hypothetical protein